MALPGSSWPPCSSPDTVQSGEHDGARRSVCEGRRARDCRSASIGPLSCTPTNETQHSRNSDQAEAVSPALGAESNERRRRDGGRILRHMP
eukprot:1668455-Prymnesium_polylepis.2